MTTTTKGLKQERVGKDLLVRRPWSQHYSRIVIQHIGDQKSKYLSYVMFNHQKLENCVSGSFPVPYLFIVSTVFYVHEF